MPGWTTTAVNGALADSLITDFGGINSPAIVRMPSDTELCLLFHYSSDAETAVQLYLAVTNAAADENIVMVWDSTYQTNPAADSTQWVTSGQVSVPLEYVASGAPMQFRITKAASDANVRWRTKITTG